MRIACRQHVSPSQKGKVPSQFACCQGGKKNLTQRKKELITKTPTPTPIGMKDD